MKRNRSSDDVQTLKVKTFRGYTFSPNPLRSSFPYYEGVNPFCTFPFFIVVVMVGFGVINMFRQWVNNL